MLKKYMPLYLVVLVVAHVGDTQKLAVIGITTREGSGWPQNFIVIEQ